MTGRTWKFRQQEDAWMESRKSGLLLPVTSLPSGYGIGDLGPSAYRFADLLAESGQSIWQVLPVNPTSTALGNSPYSSESAFAGNPLLISPEIMERDGLVSREDLPPLIHRSARRVDYREATSLKAAWISRILPGITRRIETLGEFGDFCDRHGHWLEDYALFKTLKREYQEVPWSRFPEEMANRKPDALNQFREKFRQEILGQKIIQFLFFRQWDALKRYCNERHLKLLGDVPIYVEQDSADVWRERRFFSLDAKNSPVFVAGVPPDYFSKTGQLWGNPLYDWDRMKEDYYSWWVRRMGHALRVFDMIRLDHFRGFLAYWKVPAGDKTAENGEWAPAPGEAFFSILFSHFPSARIVAEDLGVITPDVTGLMRNFDIPGMKVLLFGFGNDDPDHPFLPHNYERNCVVYTGTHDTNTVLGWFAREASENEKKRMSDYVGYPVDRDGVSRALIRLAMGSIADTVIVPVQDILGQDEGGRINLPGSSSGNWEWRLRPEQLSPASFEELAQLTRLYGRWVRKADF